MGRSYRGTDRERHRKNKKSWQKARQIKRQFLLEEKQNGQNIRREIPTRSVY